MRCANRSTASMATMPPSTANHNHNGTSMRRLLPRSVPYYPAVDGRFVDVRCRLTGPDCPGCVAIVCTGGQGL
ncbi:hypothetical protein DQ244_08945 [Blastococcus sp. TBT05-19]|nr:hypothetical protein DQ244_08945 [Blastococcus sp. TBT05-19]